MNLPATAAAGAGSSSAGREVLIWRFIGASVWHAGFWLLVLAPSWALSSGSGLFAAVTAWSSLTTVSAYLFLYALQYSVFFAQHMVMSPQEAGPLHIPQLGIHSRSWAAPFLSRVVVRGRRLQDLIGTAALLASTCFSAATFIFTYGKLRYGSSGSSPSLALSSVYGLLLGLVFSIQHLAGCRDVLDYPLIHRHRWFRVRQRLPAVVGDGIKVALLALLLLLLATRHHLISGLGGALAALHAASLCAAGWQLAHATLEVVFTEPLLPEAHSSGKEGGGVPPTTLQPLLDALSTGNGIVQDLALRQLATVAEAHTAAAGAMRGEVWGDESGRRLWVPLAGYLVEEVNEVASILAAALPSVAGEANRAAAAGSGGGQGGGPGAGMAWNMASSALRAASGRPGGGGPTRAQDMAAWVVRARLHRLSAALRAVSGLAAASRHEDRYGLVLLCEPGLADVTSALLSAVLALQQYSKLTSTATARSAGPVSRALQAFGSAVSPGVHSSVRLGSEGCAHVLADEARRCAYQVADAFGSSLTGVLKEVTSKPAYGSLGDAQALLQGILAYQE